MEHFISNGAVFIQALAAIATVLVAVVAARFSIREQKNAREAFINEMRGHWENLAESWAVVLLADQGPDYHYADADPLLREFAAKIQRGLLEDESNVVNVAASDTTIPEDQNVDDEAAELDGYQAALVLRSFVRPVVRFFAYAGDSLLRGKWTVSEAYEVFGPDLARHHKIIREVAHRGQWNNRSDFWIAQATEFNMFDEQDVVFIFAFLLRSEQCRRGDTYAHFIVELAKEMRYGHKQHLNACMRRTKRVRGKFLFPRGVRRAFRVGRKPTVRSAFMVPETAIVESSDYYLFRRILEPKNMLKARIWWTTHRGRHEDNGVLDLLAKAVKDWSLRKDDNVSTEDELGI